MKARKEKRKKWRRRSRGEERGKKMKVSREAHTERRNRNMRPQLGIVSRNKYEWFL